MSDTDEMVTLLRAGADDLTRGVVVPDGLGPRARSGGRRRLARRRTGQAVVAAALCTALAAVLPGLAWPSGAGPVVGRSTASSVYERLGASKPRGDLAGDQGYRTEVIGAWGASHASSPNAVRGIFDDLRGRARVVWAGTTPAGPAALIAQQAFLHRHSDLQLDREGLHTLLGFVGVDDRGRPRIVGDDYPAPTAPPAVAWWVDPKRTLLAVVDDGEHLGLARGWRYGHDGVRSMAFTPLVFRHGATTVRASSSAVRIAVTPYRSFGDLRSIVGDVDLDPSCHCTTPVDARLSWQAGSETGFVTTGFAIAGTRPLADYANEGPLSRFDQALAQRAHGPVVSSMGSRWYAAGALPDGRTLVLGEEALDQEVSHAYLLIAARNGSTSVVHGGAIDPASALPIAITLPRHAGWVVAARGYSLRWRSGFGPWYDAGVDAALLPTSATAVEVVASGASARIVPLTVAPS